MINALKTAVLEFETENGILLYCCASRLRRSSRRRMNGFEPPSSELKTLKRPRKTPRPRSSTPSRPPRKPLEDSGGPRLRLRKREMAWRWRM